MTELGEIPQEWDVISFFNFIEKIIDFRGRTPKKLGMDWGNGNIVALSANNVKMGKIDFNLESYYASEELYKKWMSGNELSKGDILMTMEAPLGNIAIVPDNNKYILSQRVVAFKTKDFINNTFMKYMLMSDIVQSQLEVLSTGTTAKGINQKNLAKAFVIIPTLKEQEKIASILSTVDEQIDNVDALIEKNKELKKGLMQTLLTKGIGHTKFKKTEIGEIPEEWEVKNLGNIVEVISGATPKTNINEYWDNGDIYWATPSDITSNGKYISITEKTITQSGLRNCSAKLLPIGSILMSSRATIGERCINTVPMATNQGFKSLVCKDGMNNEFIYYYVDILKEKLIGLASGSTFLEVSKKVVEDIKVVIPSLEEQEKIASILSEVDKKIEEYEIRKQKLEELKKGLMQQLLTGSIRVI